MLTANSNSFEPGLILQGVKGTLAVFTYSMGLLYQFGMMRHVLEKTTIYR
jgi:hypothetical protein